MAIIGKRNILSVIRESAPGLYLDGGELGEILLPGRYIPRDLAQKNKLDVFIYRDSEDRLVATTEIPHAMVGEFAYLKVISVNRQIGAFLDWGLAKDLLLPFREQEIPVRVGQRIIVCVYLDSKTDRIVATTRLNRHLSRDTPAYRDGQPVNLLVTGQTPLPDISISTTTARLKRFGERLPPAKRRLNKRSANSTKCVGSAFRIREFSCSTTPPRPSEDETQPRFLRRLWPHPARTIPARVRAGRECSRAARSPTPCSSEV